MRHILFRDWLFFIRESANNAVKAHNSDDTIHVYTQRYMCVQERDVWKFRTENAVTEAYLIINWFDSKSILTGTKKKKKKSRKTLIGIQHLGNTTYPARMDSNGPFQNILINYYMGQWYSLVRHTSKYMCQSKIQNIISPASAENVLTL